MTHHAALTTWRARKILFSFTYASRLVLSIFCVLYAVSAVSLPPISEKLTIQLGNIRGSCSSIKTKLVNGEEVPDEQASIAWLQGFWEDAWELAQASSRSYENARTKTNPALAKVARKEILSYMGVRVPRGNHAQFAYAIDRVQNFMSDNDVSVIGEPPRRMKPHLACDSEWARYTEGHDDYILPSGEIDVQSDGTVTKVGHVKDLTDKLEECNKENPDECSLFFLNGINEYIASEKSRYEMDTCAAWDPFLAETIYLGPSGTWITLCPGLYDGSAEAKRIAQAMPSAIQQRSPQRRKFPWSKKPPLFKKDPWIPDAEGLWLGASLYHELIHVVLGESQTTFPVRPGPGGELVRELYPSWQIVYHKQIDGDFKRLTQYEKLHNAESYVSNA